METQTQTEKMSAADFEKQLQETKDPAVLWELLKVHPDGGVRKGVILEAARKAYIAASKFLVAKGETCAEDVRAFELLSEVQSDSVCVCIIAALESFATNPNVDA